MKPLVVILILSLVSCEKKAANPPMPREQAVGIAREAAQDAFQQLSSELAKAIGSGGPVAAIPVCSTKAGTLVANVANNRKLTMVRLSDRPRNPGQAAEGADFAAIETFRAAMKRGDPPAPQVEDMPDGSTVVRLPIIASQPLCLQCHGSESEIAAETRKAILAIYPDDKATGYQLNDLRGVWRVGVSPR